MEPGVGGSSLFCSAPVCLSCTLWTWLSLIYIALLFVHADLFAHFSSFGLVPGLAWILLYRPPIADLTLSALLHSHSSATILSLLIQLQCSWSQWFISGNHWSPVDQIHQAPSWQLCCWRDSLHCCSNSSSHWGPSVAILLGSASLLPIIAH